MYFLIVLAALFVIADGSPMGRQTVSRVNGGNVVIPNSVPYQLLLLMEKDGSGFMCGGSLISPEWVLTAAHCVPEVDSVIVFVGAHNITNPDENTQIRIHVTSQNVHCHENYDPNLVRNDIALIKLPTRVEPNKYIQLMQLPTKEQIGFGQTFVGETVNIAGWGQPTDEDASASSVLQEVQSRIISTQECNTYFIELFQNQHICIQGRGYKAACNGDSGGPLVVKEPNGRLTQIGIASLVNRKRCMQGWPTVFARVSNYVDWIEKKTGLSFE